MPLPPGVRDRLAKWLRQYVQSAPDGRPPAHDESSARPTRGSPRPSPDRRRTLDMRAVQHFLMPAVKRVCPRPAAVVAELVTNLTALPQPLWPAQPAPLPDGWLLLDIETCGLHSMPVVVIGLLDTSAQRATQLIAAHHAAEPLLLQRAADALGSAPTVLTYNGSSFDVAFLADRCRYWRLAEPHLERHIDLLHHMRRRRGAVLPSLRLSDIEAGVLGVVRARDIAGAEVPKIYNSFVRDGRAELLVPVLAHNLIDLLTCWAVADMLGVASFT